jgi:hypothetical protein
MNLLREAMVGRISVGVCFDPITSITPRLCGCVPLSTGIRVAFLTESRATRFGFADYNLLHLPLDCNSACLIQLCEMREAHLLLTLYLWLQSPYGAEAAKSTFKHPKF